RLGQRTGFTSTLVRVIQENDCEICHIQFDINKEDRQKRLYSHGVLQFQLAIQSQCKSDAYAGHLKSYNKEVELQDVEIHAKGYAEWYSRGRALESNIRLALQENGELLLAKLRALLNERPVPNLWLMRNGLSTSSGRINCWGNHIPTPQSVILNDSLSKSITRYLAKVLSLYGLDDS